MRTILLASALACCAGDLAAQALRPFTTFRQWHGETRLDARLEYAAGIIRVAAGRPDDLYRMDASYDEERYLPVSDFEASQDAVTLGLTSAGRGGIRTASREHPAQTAAIAFSPRTDLALDVELGAVDGDLDLGGLRVSALRLSAGASRASVRFSKPNGIRCRIAELKAGAAELSVGGLGNSRCDRIGFEGGMGKVTLDFAGAWTSSSKVSVHMALGEVTLRLPRHAGVSITLDKFLTSFEPEGLERSGTSYRSPGYAQADRHLDIDISTAAGAVKVEWLD